MWHTFLKGDAFLSLSGTADFVSKKCFTAILSLIGLIIGLLLPSGLDYINQIDYTNITQNPEQIILGMPIAIFIEVISGLIGAILSLVIGLIIDMIRENV